MKILSFVYRQHTTNKLAYAVQPGLYIYNNVLRMKFSLATTQLFAVIVSGPRTHVIHSTRLQYVHLHIVRITVYYALRVDMPLISTDSRFERPLVTADQVQASSFCR